VVVNRLSADPSVRVLLIEAGDSGENDAAITTPGRWTSLIGSQYDWNYTTEPEPALAQRRMPTPRGRVFGGSSAINAMVHTRGDRRCFDAWQALGNPGWGYDDLLPLFKRSERNDSGASTYRGADGPLAVSRCRDAHASHHAFLAAAAEHGFRADADHDFNVADPAGVAGFYQRNILNGRRHSAAGAFLIPAMSRANVEIHSRARVTRVVIENGRAVGVEYVRDGSSERHRVNAAREVVLCAGAIGSPRLLMLSGIGSGEHLSSHGIDVVTDLHGVGGNLQDHLKLSVRWQGSATLPGSTVTAGLFTSSSASAVPDLQFYVGRGVDLPDELVSLTVSLVRPLSRGSVTLGSADPFAPPVIRANYLQADADVTALVEGVHLTRELGNARAYDSVRAQEVEPGAAVTSPRELGTFIREKADTIYHLAGTCRMGPDSDARAVVDSNLRVRGIDALRVADASIMPEVVNAPTHAACVAIGEKCADLISGR
jgi:choline dehydrogenase